MLILAIVPPCTEECRLVRVIGVLIFANPRTCVALVLLASGRSAIVDDHGADCSAVLADPDSAIYRRVRW